MNYPRIPKVDQDQYTYEKDLEARRTIETPFTQRIAYNASNMPEYIGASAPGGNVTSSVWQIKKLFYSGNFVTASLYVSGSSEFAYVWDDRATYNYE